MSTVPGLLAVIDGATLHTQSVPLGLSPAGVAVSSVTNMIYVINYCGNDPNCMDGTLTVVDGATLATQTVDVGYQPLYIAVDSVTNKIYVVNPNCCSGLNGWVTVLDGVTLSTEIVFVGVSPGKPTPSRHQSFKIPLLACSGSSGSRISEDSRSRWGVRVTCKPEVDS